MNLFIDTNILLGFYHLSNEDLDELKKLSVVVEQKEITLYLPKQVIDEFERNRDSKISDALKKFNDEKLNDQFPQICKEYDEYNTMREAISQFKQAKSALLNNLTIDIEKQNLKADNIIKELFDIATIIDIIPEILERAKTRYDLGSPPGKGKKYGDAVNWEALLEACPDEEDIYFITNDKDYFSELNEDRFSSFLLKEWGKKKRSEIIFSKRLSSFLQENFPQITLASELEKELLIRDLTNSYKIARTKQILKNLSKFNDFSDDELNDIVLATISNNQIYWIIGDPIVKDALGNIVNGNEARIDPDQLMQFKALINQEEGSDSTDT